ncbi:hypothetical protein E4U47_005445 [Claviceps purpurea]|nr:hypothetical protein E4U27_006746 [Claviceps purpurea]KAG6278496.1 hypothetical protein E4U47_005445 [Claviceps purpurea]KAG6307388.1 hypothetical protein E4U45_004854 [Claviceps purpurea]
MLLLHQVGSVKVGEVVRYSLTYTPSQDRILPSPEKLHVRIRNTSTIALRAAFVHGPYTLSVSAYPSHFNPNEKFTNPRRYGAPRFEPMLKAGGSWECELIVPDNIRQDAGIGSNKTFGKGPEHDGECAKWVIEIASQVIFSTSAAVGFDVVVARDHKSLNLNQSLSSIGGNFSQVPQPGKLIDHRQSVGAKDGHHPGQPKGVFSRAIQLKVEDSAALWNTPSLPGWDDDAGNKSTGKDAGANQPVQSVVNTGHPEIEELKQPKKPHGKKKKVHLVILTHGLHSNLGADMLYMKESIDAAARQARIDAKARRAKERAAKKPRANKQPDGSMKEGLPPKEGEDGIVNYVDDDDDDDDDDEEVIVRGYPGNATKTEKGIKYLGKRLSRYILSMTYPDQPFLPIAKGALKGGAGEGAVEALTGDHHHHHHSLHPHHLFHQDQPHQNDNHEVKQAHKNSDIQADTTKAKHDRHCRSYQITSISFVGHSLGGLIQTYAIAYIQKHSPKFFDLIQPVNFIAMATPFLGLSNENPLYVKFALDFGLVGRTGQDLGLTWRAPTIARIGWGALVSNLGESAHKKVYGESQPESKPLLRILPTGPAHTALKKFRNRTVYSNVVNDGIVPLRTSCLLFLDWQGLGRVEKARRDAGLVETVVGFGWAELTGTNMASSRRRKQLALEEEQQDDSGTTTPKGSPKEGMRQVPQPSNDAMHEDERASIRSVPRAHSDEDDEPGVENSSSNNHHNGPGSGINSRLSTFFGLFKSQDPPKPQVPTAKQKRMLRRGQTMPLASSDIAASSSTDESDRKQQQPQPSKATTGHEVDGYADGMSAPPKTTFFESAGDVLNPSIPSEEYLLDPSKRPRTIFHDRVYHPSDIPPPPPPPPLKKRQSTFGRRSKNSAKISGSPQPSEPGSRSTSPLPPNNPLHADSKETVSGKDHGDDTAKTSPELNPSETVDASNMRVEEKIARGYHRDLSWRKVLVKLEPDAHNNMIVRRMFANAHGWPVIKHMVDAHFSDSETARIRDEEEPNMDRAFEVHHGPAADGREVRPLHQLRNEGDYASGGDSKREGGGEVNEAGEEALDEVPELPKKSDSESIPLGRPRLEASDRADSMTWSDRDWVDSDNESDMEAYSGGKSGQPQQSQQSQQSKESSDAAGTTSPTLSPSSWKWAAEKIVGKGAVGGRSKSPQS